MAGSGDREECFLPSVREKSELHLSFFGLFVLILSPNYQQTLDKLFEIMKKATLCLLACLLCSLPAIQNASAQLPDDQTIVTLTAEAVGLMDNGEPDEAIRLLEDALELDPKSYLCRYEMAYAYYMKQDYAKVVKILKPLVKHPERTPLLYQMLGNAYDMNGNPGKAIETYEKGLARYPESGALYVEKGSVLAKQQNFAEAVESYSQAIKVDPLYAPGYYWSARFFSALNQSVRAMLYAEIFMILAPEDPRNTEMSHLLFDNYNRHLILTDGSVRSDFCKTPIFVDESENKGRVQMYFFPFEAVYGKMMEEAVEGISKIDLASLNQVRTRFFSSCWKNMTDIQKALEASDYPDLAFFFSFIREVEQAGYLEAYNYWILRGGRWDEFQAWYEENSQEFGTFAVWFLEQDMKIVDPQELLSELQAAAAEESSAGEGAEQPQSELQSETQPEPASASSEDTGSAVQVPVEDAVTDTSSI